MSKQKNNLNKNTKQKSKTQTNKNSTAKKKVDKTSYEKKTNKKVVNKKKATKSNKKVVNKKKPTKLNKKVVNKKKPTSKKQIDKNKVLKTKKEAKVHINKSVDNIDLSTRERKRLKQISNIIFLAFLILFAAAIFKVFALEVFHNVEGVNLKDFSSNQYTQETSLESTRGNIYDSSGEALTINIKQYKLYAVLNPKNTKYNTETYNYDPYYVKDPKKTADEIIKILGYEDNQEAKDLINKQLRLDPNKYSQVEFSKYGDNLSIMQKKALEEANLPGLYFEEKDNRYYPFGDFASYIIGYAAPTLDKNGNLILDEDGKVDIEGQMGVEKLLNSYLKGQDGETIQETDKQDVPIGKEQVVTPKVDGTDVYLTLDSNVNAYVHDYMLEELKGEGFDSAGTVVMDAKTGAILGAEKISSFNPNKKDIEDYNDPFFQNCFEPGSTIKTLLVATAIMEDKWNPQAKSNTGKRVDSKWGDSNYIADWIYNEHRISWGSITWEQGYYFSSNVVMTHILDSVGYDTWVDYAKNTWELGVPLENELYKSNACSFEPEYDFEKATTSFGQGMTASIMQILRAYSTFAGNGKMVNPYIIQSINDSDTGEKIYDGASDKPKNWEDNKDVSFNKDLGVWQKNIMTEEQNKEVLRLLKGGAYYNEGGWFASTGRRYGETTKYKIGAKTGTSQVAVNGNYNNNQTIASVAAVAPVDDPQILVYTYVVRPVNPTPQTYMSRYLGKIIDNSLDYLNKEKSQIKGYNKDEVHYVQVDNYLDKEVSEAKEDLKNKKIKYEVIGSGKVVGQYPVGGTKVNKNQKVYLVGKKLDLNTFKSKDKSYVQNFCSAVEDTCTYEGTGNKVSSVKKSGNKYLITLK